MERVGTPLGMNSLPRARLILMVTAFLKLRTDLMARAGVFIAFTKLAPASARAPVAFTAFLITIWRDAANVSEHWHAGPAAVRRFCPRARTTCRLPSRITQHQLRAIRP